jgi:hypothetical protein
MARNSNLLQKKKIIQPHTNLKKEHKKARSKRAGLIMMYFKY